VRGGREEGGAGRVGGSQNLQRERPAGERSSAGLFCLSILFSPPPSCCQQPLVPLGVWILLEVLAR
jgi:hypothetical protein